MTWMIGWGFFTNFVERAVIFNRRYESPLYRVIGDLYIVYYVVLSRFKVAFNIHNIIYMYLYIYIYTCTSKEKIQYFFQKEATKI